MKSKIIKVDKITVKNRDPKGVKAMFIMRLITKEGKQQGIG
jgi:hypothetical protein